MIAPGFSYAMDDPCDLRKLTAQIVGVSESGAQASAYQVNPDPFEQFLLWEQQENLSVFRQPIEKFPLQYSLVPKRDSIVWMSSGAPEGVVSKFIRGEQVVWPKHPHNTDPGVLHYFDPVAGAWPARYTSSRSIVVVGSHPERISVKLPTDHPHVNGKKQPNKASIRDDILSAKVRTEYILLRNRIIQQDPSLIFLYDVMTVSDKSGAGGFLVRDLSPLQDGNYYLEATAIPYVGRKIAQLQGEDFATLWKEAYSKKLGIAKARLLLDYGIQHETPNAQNFLIQLDTKLRPTGKIAMRDLSDTVMVRPVADAIGEGHMLRLEEEMDYPIASDLQPNSGHSFSLFDVADDHAVPVSVLVDWETAHDQAYIQEVLRLLAIGPSKKNLNSLSDLQRFIYSDEGRAALANYALRRRPVQKAP